MTSHVSSHHEPEEPHGTTVPMPHHHVAYVKIFFALVVLTVVTVAIAFKRFDSEAVNVLLALLVASVKASLVAMYFMHLKFEGKLIYFIAIVPLVLCVILVCALIPDVVNSPHFNDTNHSFLKIFHVPGQHAIPEH
jgi:cytochrome c oxidase subunit IV